MRVLVYMPTYDGRCHVGAAFALVYASTADNGIEVVARTQGGSILTSVFNAGWAMAQDAYAAGKIDAFAMIHSDVAAPQGWLDVLEARRIAAGVDLISAVIPIKDETGKTSTAVDDTGDPWRPRRLTMRQLADLPETFTSEHVGAPLLVNTGLWVCRLGPWCLDVAFGVDDLIRKEDVAGQSRRYARVVPEDWGFSRQLHRRGLKLAATKIPLKHHGDYAWDSTEVWGWDRDYENDPVARAEALGAVTEDADAK